MDKFCNRCRKPVKEYYQISARKPYFFENNIKWAYWKGEYCHECFMKFALEPYKEGS